ncbi:hypothetical protein J6590_098573 [Homalodisca vitripennis]|nr:hypothetical protein J6590_098573 [Homalodisca vitripennis]
MIVNLYVLYKINTDNPISRLDFTVALVEGLAAEWLGDQAPVQAQRAGNEPLDLLPGGKERNCSVCSRLSTAQGGKRKKTGQSSTVQGILFLPISSGRRLCMEDSSVGSCVCPQSCRTLSSLRSSPPLAVGTAVRGV